MLCQMVVGSDSQSGGARRGFPWVPAQHLLTALLVFVPVATHDGPVSKPLFVASTVLFLVGGTIGIWSVGALGRNRRPSPEPMPDGELVQGGPYRWVRHPMYVGLWLSLVGWVCMLGSPIGMGLLAPMTAVLMGKARVEERLMSKRHPGYLDYAGRTGRFVPWIGRICPK